MIAKNERNDFINVNVAVKLVDKRLLDIFFFQAEDGIRGHA